MPTNDPEPIAVELEKRIGGLRRRQSFVRYGESFALAKELRALVESIRDHVFPDLPDRAFALADAFLSTDANVYGHVDDSSGIVGDAYSDACLLWLDTAARSSRSEDWVERVRAMAGDNDYGVRDPLLPNAHRLLSEHELRRLVRIYQAEAKGAKPDHATEARGWWLDVVQVAKALRDPKLLERAERAYGRPFNDRLGLEIARYCVEWGRIDEALDYLGKVEDHGDYSRNSLLLRCFEIKGDTGKQVEFLWILFEAALDHDNYSKLLELLPDHARSAARDSARALALRYEYATTAVEFLLRTGWEDDAERVAVERRDEFEDTYYGTLLELIKLAGEARRPRIEIVCYRRLLLQILDERRSKAYGHAARYFRRLAQLDEQIDDYGGPQDHATFVETLRSDHGRKYAFWNRVEARPPKNKKPL